MKTLEDILTEYARATGISYDEALSLYEKALTPSTLNFKEVCQSLAKTLEKTANLIEELPQPRPTSHRPNRFYDKLNR